MPGEVDVRLSPRIPREEWIAAMQALARDARLAMAQAGRQAGIAFRTNFELASGAGLALRGAAGGRGPLLLPPGRGGVFPGGGEARALGFGGPSGLILPGARGVPVAGDLGIVRAIGPSGRQTGGFFAREAYVQDFIRRNYPAAGPLAIGTGDPDSLSGYGRQRTTILPPRGPFSAGTRDRQFVDNLYGNVFGDALNVDSSDVTGDGTRPGYIRGPDTRYGARGGAGRPTSYYVGDFNRDSLEDLQSGQRESTRDRATTGGAASRGPVRGGASAAAAGAAAAGRGGGGGGAGRGGYASSVRQQRFGDLLLGSATFAPRGLRAPLLGLGFASRFGGTLGLAGVAVGGSAGVAALLTARAARGYNLRGSPVPANAEAADAIRDLRNAASSAAGALTETFGPAMVGVISEIADALNAIADYGTGLGARNDPNLEGAARYGQATSRVFGGLYHLGRAGVSVAGAYDLDAFLEGGFDFDSPTRDRLRESYRALTGTQQRGGPVDRVPTVLPQHFDEILVRGRTGYGQITDRAQEITVIGDAAREAARERDEELRQLNSQRASDYGVGRQLHSLRALDSAITRREATVVREEEYQYTSNVLIEERIRLERDLSAAIAEETQLRYRLIQQEAARALNIPSEQRGLNVALSELRQFSGVTPSTSGYPRQLQLGELLGDIGGQLAGLEGASLDALFERATRPNLSSPPNDGDIGRYIQEFVSDQYNFDLPNSFVDLYDQQIGSARATDASEQLALQREEIETRQINNDRLSDLNDVMDELTITMNAFFGNILSATGGQADFFFPRSEYGGPR